MKIRYIVAIVLFFFIATGAFLTPGIVKDKLVVSLEDIVEEKTQINDIKFNLFSGEVELLGLSLGKSLVLKRLSVRPSYFSLLSKKIILKRLRIEGLELNAIPKLKNTKAKIKKKNSSSSSELVVAFDQINLSELLVDHSLLPLKKNLLIEKANLVDMLVDGSNISGNLRESSFEIADSKFNINAQFEKSKKLIFKAEVEASDLSLGILEISKIDDNIDSLKGVQKINLLIGYKDGEIDTKIDTEIDKFGYHPKKGASYEVSNLKLFSELSVSKEKLSVKNTSLFIKNLLQKSPDEADKKIEKLEVENLKLFKEKKNASAFMTLNKNGKIDFNNKENVFSGTIKNLDLKNFSNFLVLDEESQVGSGKLFLNLNGKIKKSQNLEGDLKLYISQMNIEKSGNKEISLISTSRAVSLIKDKNGKIEIESKLSGSLNDPSFNFLYFLSKGIGNVLAEKFYSLLAVEAAKKVAPLLLSSIPINPLNAISIFKKGYDLAVKPRFAGMIYEPHSIELKKRELKVLDRVLKFLKKEKEISLSFCVETYLNEGQSKLSLEEAKKLRLDRSAAIIRYILKKTPRVEPQVVFCSDKAEIEDIGRGSLEVEL